MRFPNDVDLADEVVGLASADHDCCTFLGFHLHLTTDHLDLRVTGSAEAQLTITKVLPSARNTR